MDCSVMEVFEHMTFKSSKQKALVLQLCKELVFVRAVEDLKVHQVAELDMVYLSGTLSENQDIFVPVAADETLSMSRISTIQDYILQKHEAKKLTLALMDTDSTTVFFCITPGFLPPPDSHKETAIKDKLIQDQNFINHS